jgi:hypothetical protein
MRLSTHTATAALCLATQATAHTRLQHWPKDAAAALDKMMAANANSSNYACFDMDVRDLASNQLTYPQLLTSPEHELPLRSRGIPTAVPRESRNSHSL